MWPFRKASTTARVTSFQQESGQTPQIVHSGVKSFAVNGQHLLGMNAGGKVVLVVPVEHVSSAVVEETKE